ncbi:MAG: sortase A [Glaciecola sp.]|jgi:sortase A
MASPTQDTTGLDVEGLAFPDPITNARRTTPMGFMLDAIRRRPVGRTILSSLTTILFIAGAGMFTYPFFTDVYTTQILQSRLADELVQIDVDVNTESEWVQTVAGQVGRPVTTINIPALELEMIVVEGTSPDALRAGAGHYPNTPLPGQAGNVAIAGHRTTYGRPFNRIDELSEGDFIWLSTPVGDHRYVVARPDYWDYSKINPDSAGYITDPRDWTVIAAPGNESSNSSAPTAGVGGAGAGNGDYWLTLTTCHPKGSAAQRLIVRATLGQSFPPGTYEARKAQGTLDVA